MEGKRPDYHVFVVREGKGEKFHYTEIGVGWKVANDGVAIRLHALPTDGKLVMFPPKGQK